MKPLLIAIGGGSGSGKTTVAKQIAGLLGSKEVTLIHLDNYYKDNSKVPKKDIWKINFDHPEALDWDLFKKDLELLSKGKPIKCPVYSFIESSRLKETTYITPKKAIIIEGVFALCNKDINKMYNLRIFIDTDDDVRLARRLLRDVNERNVPEETTINYWMNVVKPMHELFIEPSKKYSHIILPEHERGVSIELIKEGIKGLIK